MSWTFHEGELGREDVHDLLDRHFAEMRAVSPPSACHVLPPGELGGPEIRLFTLREGGVLLGCGALKRLTADHGEIKSMRTTAGALSRGVGKALLRHILECARSGGMTRISLETGSTPHYAPALRLYESEGFEPCEPFGGYVDTPFTRFYSRAI